MRPCLVAVDFGTGAVRSVVFDLSGKQLGSAYLEIAYDSPPHGPPGAAEFSGPRMWARIARVVRLSLLDAHIGSADVIGVSAASQRHGVALLDKRGRTLYAGPNRDNRGSAVFDPTKDEAAYVINGRWPMSIMAPYRLRWFRQRQAEIFERAAAMLMLNDWVVYQLCGEAACATSSAAESLLFDIKSLDWSPSLLEHFGLPRWLFPPVVEGGQVVGRVTARAAKATGLPQGVPVAAGGGDTQCALLACRAVNPGDVAIVAGTTAPVQSVALGPDLDPQGRAWTGVHVAPGRWVHESNAGPAGILLRWFRDQFGCDGPGRKPPADAYERLLGPASAVSAGCDGLTAVLGPPLLQRGKSYPRNRAFVYAPDGFRPMELSLTRAHFVRAMVESIVFAIKANYEQLPEMKDGRPSGAALCGGCSRSPLFVQTVADVLDQTIVLPEASEVAALGAAMCAAVGAGAYRTVDEAVQQMTRVRPAAEPKREAVQAYQAHFQRWRRINEAVSQWG